MQAKPVDRDTLTQVSTLEILLAGGYFPWTKLHEIGRRGDFGLGTFTHLDGEMVQVDGVIYQVFADGNVQVPDDSQSSPFFVTTFFDVDQTTEITQISSFSDLQVALKSELPSPNYIYALRARGRLDYLKTRSVPAQTEPYPPLADVAATQPTFEFQNVEGTLVGFYFPEAFADINVPGFHFHFVTADKTGGGHVLDLKSSQLLVELDQTHRFALELPQADAYRDFDLARSKSQSASSN